jgi:4-hydroxybenzoate polyprenyltransferase
VVKEFIKDFLKNIRPLKSLHFMVMASLGCYFSRNFQILPWILSLVAVFSVWQYTIHLNDVFDVEIDRISHADRPLVKHEVSQRSYIILLICLLCVVFGISIYLGWVSVLVASIYVGLATIYSAPPFRMRQYIIQTIFIGAGSMLAFFFGFSSLNSLFSGEIAVIGSLVFLGLSTGTVIKDYKDYEGDKAANVTTLFTKFGVNQGLLISYILLVITFLLPLVLIHQITDVLVIIGFAILTMFVFRKWKQVSHVFIFYFIVLLYTFLRYEGFLMVF